MKKRRILVIEDDGAIRRGIVDALLYEGYEALQADNGDDGLKMSLRTQCDLILLDLVLPRREGFDILKEVHAAKPTLPVIILTAKGEEEDRVRGLKLGADDYVVKPFSIKELLARVSAVLRRSPERPLDINEVPIPAGMVALERCEVRFEDGDRAALSEREVEILRYLAANSGRAISREEILSRIWGLNPRAVTTRTIDMHITRLREKLRDKADDPSIILTVRGKGYMFAGQEGAQ